MEDCEGPTIQDKGENLMAATGHLFEDMTDTYHPPGVAGVWQARSSNVQWAFRPREVSKSEQCLSPRSRGVGTPGVIWDH